MLVKIDANFPDGLAPIFSKMRNMKYLHDILAYAKNFDPQSLRSPKKMAIFYLDLPFSHGNLRLSQKVFMVIPVDISLKILQI